MGQKPILNASSFERLMEAAWVIQQHLKGNQSSAAESATTSSAAQSASTLATLHTAPYQAPAAATEKTRAARPVMGTLTAPENAETRPKPFAGHRVKGWVTFNSKLTLRPRRALTAAGALLLLITGAVALLQVNDEHPPIVAAATSTMTHHSVENAVAKAEPFRLTPPDAVSHKQITDQFVSSVVKGLSPYEIGVLRRQADYGDDTAALIIGMAYETGHYVPQSCTKAAAWVAKSANGGNAAAQYNLGLRYRDGDGLPANEDEAEKWLRKAAAHKYPSAALSKFKNRT